MLERGGVMNKITPRISVVVATYNGERYILEQLESIRNQTTKPDEVIIRDDMSTDNSIEIIQNYIKENNLNSWQLIKGEQNVGWKVNFEKALKSTTGDIIFLCDQDDIWVEDKINVMASILFKNSDIELLASDYDLLINGKKICRNHKSQFLSKVKISKRFFHTTKPGAVYGFKKTLLEEMQKKWNNTLPHDAQLWVLASLRESLYILNQPMILYRRHDNTATGRDELALAPKLRNLMYERELIKFSIEYCETVDTVQQKTKLFCYQAFKYVKAREKLLKNGKLIDVIHMLKYINFYIRFKTFIGDILVVRFKK